LLSLFFRDIAKNTAQLLSLFALANLLLAKKLLLTRHGIFIFLVGTTALCRPVWINLSLRRSRLAAAVDAPQPKAARRTIGQRRLFLAWLSGRQASSRSFVPLLARSSNLWPAV
jgi:hypothetical protein